MEELEDEDAEDIPFLPESQIKQYIKEIETNESQFLGTTLREIYQKNVRSYSPKSSFIFTLKSA